jgi:hypothetical protein
VAELSARAQLAAIDRAAQRCYGHADARSGLLKGIREFFHAVDHNSDQRCRYTRRVKSLKFYVFTVLKTSFRSCRNIAAMAATTLRGLLREVSQRTGIKSAARALQPPIAMFADSFPGKAKEAVLKRHLWWWRYANEKQCQKIFPRAEELGADYPRLKLQNYEDLLQPSAFFYEFRARYNGRYKYDLGVPWINCSFQDQWCLRELVPDKHPDRYFSPATSKGNHWMVINNVMVNVSLPDSAICESIMLRVAAERRKRRIKKRRIRVVPFSWRAIETMDLTRYVKDPMSDSQRGLKSRETKFYLENCARLGLEP